MAEHEVDALLARMPQIAAAVNAFTSEVVQQAALAALVSAFEVGPHHKRSAAADIQANENILPNDQGPSKGNGVSGAEGEAKKRRRVKSSNGSAGKSTNQIVRDLNLRPDGVEPFADFVTKKEPQDNQERFLVAVYYLEQVAKISSITEGHLAATFKQTNGWREPANIGTGVRMTAHRKNWLDTSDMANIRTTPHGRNYVQHDMPTKPKSKSR